MIKRGIHVEMIFKKIYEYKEICIDMDMKSMSQLIRKIDIRNVSLSVKCLILHYQLLGFVPVTIFIYIFAKSIQNMMTG